MNLTKITQSEIENAKKREYNPSIWQNRINEYTERFEKLQFYVGDTGNNYYVVFEAEDGIIVMNEICFSGGLFNREFTMMLILPDGEVMITGSQDGMPRERLAAISQASGAIFTKVF